MRTINRPPCAGRPDRLCRLKQTLSELTGPVYGHESVGPLDHDLTKNGAKDGEPLGERIVVTGRVLDEIGRPVPDALIEIWQANAAGRYIHEVDQHDAPLDPNFFGGGRCVTDGEGCYRFLFGASRRLSLGQSPQCLAAEPYPPVAVRPGPSGAAGDTDVLSRRSACLISIRSIRACRKVRANGWSPNFSIDVTEPDFALGYVFDIVLRGRGETPMET